MHSDNFYRLTHTYKHIFEVWGWDGTEEVAILCSELENIWHIFNQTFRKRYCRYSNADDFFYVHKHKYVLKTNKIKPLNAFAYIFFLLFTSIYCFQFNIWKIKFNSFFFKYLKSKFNTFYHKHRHFQNIFPIKWLVSWNIDVNISNWTYNRYVMYQKCFQTW